MNNNTNPIDLFTHLIEEIYVQEQVLLIDQLCRESEDTMSTPISSIINSQNRNLQRLRRDSVFNVSDLLNNSLQLNSSTLAEPVPANQYEEEIGNLINNTSNEEMTGDITTVFRNIFNHMEHEMRFTARNNILSNFDNFDNLDDSIKVTLSEHEYDNIPLKVVERGECNICLEEYDNTTCKVLKCNHSYHDKCLKEWLTKQSTCCPICRIDVKNNI